MPRGRLPRGLLCMFQNLLCNSKKGVTVVEIMIVTAVIGLALSSLLGLASFSLTQSQLMNQTAQAVALSQEQLEAVRNIRDGVSWESSLGSFAQGVDYHPSLSLDDPPKWQMVQGVEVLGIFSRSLIFTDALRNADFDIVESSGNPDPNTKKVLSTVSWSEKGRPHQVQLTSYLTNWRQ